MEILSTKNNYPWYDSQWLNVYVQAKELIKHHYPSALLEEFVTTMDVLKTRTDFQVVKQERVFDEKILVETRKLIGKLFSDELEKEEFFNFGRLVIHDHTYFNQLQNTVTDLVSEVTQELVEPYYNFLALYNNFGVCKVHMDALFAKWTLDLCIDQSELWPIYLSQVLPWPENLNYVEEDWESKIKNNPDNNFSEYNLEVGGGIIFSGSSQWHYLERILQKQQQNYCHLIFFHFIPKGTREIVDPANWASLFSVPELAKMVDEIGETSTISRSG